MKDGLTVSRGAKLGDIHPEVNREIVFSVTDKAWAIGNGVLEAISTLQEKGIPDPKKFNRLVYERLQGNLDKGNPGILYTLLEAPDHYTVHSGSHLLVLPGDYVYGTLGNFSLDNEMTARAKRLLSQPKPSTDIIHVELFQHDNSTAKVLEEPFFPQKTDCLRSGTCCFTTGGDGIHTRVRDGGCR